MAACPTDPQISNIGEFNKMVNDPQESTTEGIKRDINKPRMDLLPPEGLVRVAEVMGYGAAKYGDHNYRMGMRHGRLIAAAMRHITAYNNGEDRDPETGHTHIAHAGACVLMLLQMMADYPERDDRYHKEKKEDEPNHEDCGGESVGISSCKRCPICDGAVSSTEDAIDETGRIYSWDHYPNLPY